jgi:hypothetical protein
MIRAAGWAALLAGLGLVALPQLLYPLGFDQAVYAACGDAIRRGGVPIKDCFETKQMGVMLMYSIAQRLSPSPPAIHALTLLWTAATSVIVAWLCGRLFAPGAATTLARLRAGAWAGIFYWLMYAGINYWSMGQAETFSNLFLVVAWAGTALAPARGRRAAALLTGAGAAIGAAIWFKYVFALPGVALGIVLLARIWIETPGLARTRLLAAGRSGALFAAGALAVCAGVAAYYALADGFPALGDQFQLLRDIFPLAPPRPFPEMVAMMLRFLDNGADLTARFKATLPVREYIVLGGGFPLVIGLAAAGAVARARGAVLNVSAGLGLLTAAAGLVIWQGNYIQYHYTLLMPPLAVFAGAAAYRVSDSPSRPGAAARLAARGLAIAAAVLLVWRMWPVMTDAWANTVVERKTLSQMYAESYQAPHIPMAEQIAATTGPNDSIAIIGDAPWVYTLAGRANATRFAFVNQWLKRPGTVSYTTFVGQYHSDLARNRPVYVLLVKAGFPWEGVDYLPDYKAAAPIYNYIETNYQYDGENGPFLLFKRK